MCTVIVANHAHPAFPVVVAANRDEMYARRSTPPQILRSSPCIVGGRDGERGGTWLGVNERGLFAAITNQRTWHAADRSRRSRGEVVLGVLERESPDAAAAFLASLDGAQYNPFNLVFGDANAMFVAYVRDDPASARVDVLPHGLWVLPNDVIDSPDFPKVQLAKDIVAPVLAEPFDTLVRAMKTALKSHTVMPDEKLAPPPPDSGVSMDFVRALSPMCIHAPLYGTHSASVVALEPGRVAHYEFAAGPSCEHPFVDVTPLFRAR
jgi:uncharacterized protein with NRDE domain